MGESYQEINSRTSLSRDSGDAGFDPANRHGPEDLRRFVQEKVGTNPFYLEEMINSLIESGILRPITATGNSPAIGESEIPSTIHAVIAAA